ncbi:hypothetical protein HIM_00368 [Hirsutella minnesotensis 3608]|nr:hypothetical protein HIM_00368 [Hirsutella minnesotensis 3608]
MNEADLQESAAMRLGKTFQILTTASDSCSPRLGRLVFRSRRPIETPNYTATTSRGAVPHLTPDNLAKHTSIPASYLALEDFVEKVEPPIYKAPDGQDGRLHKFLAMPSDRTTILAARRCPAVITPMGNGAKFVSLFTSQGYRSLTVAQFASVVESLRPDVVVALGDALHTSAKPASKKLVKMVERTESWVDEFLQQFGGRQRLDELGISVFAPVLPVDHPTQWEYLKHLAEDVTGSLSGLALYSVNLLPELSHYPSLMALPRMSLDLPRTPHEVLRHVSLGIDLCSIPFLNTVSDSGVALTFDFPPPKTDTPLPLGVDMWSPEHSMSLGPLIEGCPCYTCTKHHRAYLHHLLNAKEMLGWTLLQIHNHYVLDNFFAGVRRSLGKGVAEFEQDRERFTASYEPELPEGSGERPRARGYHFKAEAGQEKMNKPRWSSLDDKAVQTSSLDAA